MSKDFGVNITIVPAVTANKIAVTRVEVFTPVHAQAGETTEEVEIQDANGNNPGDVDYERTTEVQVMESWDALDPLGSQSTPDTKNEERRFFVDYQDENGKEYRITGATITEVLDAGLDPAKLVAAHNALKDLAYDDATVSLAGLPPGGVVN